MRVTALAPVRQHPTVSESGGPVRGPRTRAGLERGARPGRGQLAVDARTPTAGGEARGCDVPRAGDALGQHERRLVRPRSPRTDESAATKGGGRSATLGSLVPDGQFGTALYDAVVLSTSTLGRMPDGTRVLVLLTGRPRPLARAIARRRDRRGAARGSVVYPIAAGERPTPSRSRARIGDRRQGLRRHDDGRRSASRALGRELDRTWQLTYLERLPGRRGRPHRARRQCGGQRVCPHPGSRPSGDPFALFPPASRAARSPRSRWHCSLRLVALAAAAPCRRRRRSPVRRLLERYVAVARPRGGTAEQSPRPCVPRVDRALDGRPAWVKRLNQTFERAGRAFARLPPYLGALAASSWTDGKRRRRPAATLLLVMLAGLAVPFVVLRIAAHRRMKAFDRQLPTCSGRSPPRCALDTGSGLRQGHRRRRRRPASEEFARVIGEKRLGRPLAEAINAMCSGSARATSSTSRPRSTCRRRRAARSRVSSTRLPGPSRAANASAEGEGAHGARPVVGHHPRPAPHRARRSDDAHRPAVHDAPLRPRRAPRHRNLLTSMAIRA